MKAIILITLFFSFVLGLEKKANLLINEESPYLLQHAYNPVNWYTWNKKAFKKAEEENKLIFVSIGYSTCHWCHVMEEESFENDEIAKLLNKDYINIKVDREELPHIDATYQDILTKLKKRRNGWPLNFILSPDKKIVYISTYIPNVYKYEVEGMNTLIPRIANEFKQNKLSKTIEENKKKLIEKENIVLPKNDEKLATQFVKLMNKRYDKLFHGFDRQPKFPLATHLNLLFEISQLRKDEKLFKQVEDSAIAMANGGIFDQVEGGFYRYSVYADWIVPHFEKMLYTQAELIPLYYKLYIKTGNILFKNTIEKTIKEVNKKFKSSQNLFFSAIDADSKNSEGEKEEGFYYTYNYDFVVKILKQNDIKNYEEILEYLGFDDFGNFENELNNIYITRANKKPKNLEKTIKILKEIRKKRELPFIDKKVITSWNSLMIKSLFIASNINKKYLVQAESSLASLLKNLYIQNILYHQKLDTNKPKQKALLEDFTFLTDLLLTAYQTSYKKEYLNLAKKLNKETIHSFYKNNTWYFDSQKEYKVNFIDRYYVSAISKFFHNSLTIANLSYDLELLNKTKKLIKEQEKNILLNLDKHPESVRALIRLEYKDIILKSNQQNLLKNKNIIEKINYPFILSTIEKTDMFLACDEKSCFAYDKDLNKLIKTFDK